MREKFRMYRLSQLQRPPIRLTELDRKAMLSRPRKTH